MSASKPRSSFLPASSPHGRDKTNKPNNASTPHKFNITQSYDSTGDVTAQLNALRATLERSSRSTDLRYAAEVSPLQLSTNNDTQDLDERQDTELGRDSSSSTHVLPRGSSPSVLASSRSSARTTRSVTANTLTARIGQNSSNNACEASALTEDLASMDEDEFKAPGHRPGQNKVANSSVTTTSPINTDPAFNVAGSRTSRSVRRALIVSQRDENEVISYSLDHTALQPHKDARDVQVGDDVHAMGFEGTLRYLGEVQFKDGTWGGIELSAAHAGKGKNNGSVQGITYFSCPPNCGIFVPAQKISSARASSARHATLVDSPIAPRNNLVLAQSTSYAMPTPRRSGVPGIPSSGPRHSAAFVPPSTITRARAAQSTDAARQALEKVRDGSKAAAYLNLGAQRAPPASQTTTQDRPSPRKVSMSASVTNSATPRPARSSMQRSTLAASTTSAGQTPGTSIAPRRSLLGGAGAGPNTPTPAARKHLRSHTPDIPNVPPLPANLSMSTASGPYAVRSDGALSSSTTPGRRQSAAAATARPMTPSAVRPSSRASTASVMGTRSVSRASSRASMASTASSRLRDTRTNDDSSYSSATTGMTAAVLADNTEALANAQRDAEQAKLELLEMHTELRDEKKRTKALQLEITELKRKAQSSRLDEASAIDERAAEKEQHYHIVADLESRLQRVLHDLEEAQTRQACTEDKTSDLTIEVQRLRSEKDILDSSTAELKRQVEHYKTGGKELLEIYESKLAAAEKRHVEDLEALQVIDSELFSVQTELAHAQQQAADEATAVKVREANSMDAFVAASMTAVRTTAEGQSAVEIDNENLKAEVDHLKSRLLTLEEQLDDSREQVSRSNEAIAQCGVSNKEAVAKLKQQMMASQQALAEERLEKARLLDKTNELQKAVQDSAHALENDRAELEALRQDSSQTCDTGNEARDLQSYLSKVQVENEAKTREIEHLKAEIVILQEEIRLTEDIKAESSAALDLDPREVESLKSSHQSELVSKNAEIEDLLRRLRYAEARVPTIAEAPPSPAIPLSPSHDTSTTSTLSPSHASVPGHSSPSAFDLRTKRESAGSVFSAITSISRKSSKDEGTSMRDEISGLKFIIKRGEDERVALSAQNLTLTSEASKLREAHGILERKFTDMTNHDALSAPERTRLEQGNRITHLEDELSQMEAVMLARIQHEEMLESQLEDMKQALRDARQGDTAKRAIAASGARVSPEGRASGLSTKGSPQAAESNEKDDDKCEVCGALHAVQDCPIFAPSGLTTASKTSTALSTAVYCDDCESSEHDLKDCPLASEIW